MTHRSTSCTVVWARATHTRICYEFATPTFFAIKPQARSGTTIFLFQIATRRIKVRSLFYYILCTSSTLRGILASIRTVTFLRRLMLVLLPMLLSTLMQHRTRTHHPMRHHARIHHVTTHHRIVELRSKALHSLHWHSLIHRPVMVLLLLAIVFIHRPN